MTLLRDGLKVGGAVYVAKQFFDHRDKKYEAQSKSNGTRGEIRDQTSQSQINTQAATNGGYAREYYQQSGYQGSS